MRQGAGQDIDRGASKAAGGGLPWAGTRWLVVPPPCYQGRTYPEEVSAAVSEAHPLTLPVAPSTRACRSPNSPLSAPLSKPHCTHCSGTMQNNLINRALRVYLECLEWPEDIPDM